ncbi:MAG: MtnX-like HAD-IB family phosphatase [Chloroflexi bacterium]|nr:MtnX-like HAD-IB family phosphatase [Chloroflexota bacterium]
MRKASKTLVQCDFDGTVTEEDVSFVLLDAFAEGDWRQLHREYEADRISVGRFNTEAFAMVKADRESLLALARSKVKIRAGFQQMVSCCRRKGFRLIIVSNGLDFYIDGILKDMGLADIEFFAAKTQFHPEGLKVQYIGPDGRHWDEGIKEANVNLFLNQGYRVIYMGNGTSDFSAAKRCQYIFATDTLLACCRQTQVDCIPFTDFNQVVKGLERL